MNSQYDSRTADKFVVRMPDGLRAEIDSAACRLDTSMNTVFVRALRQYLDDQNRQQLLLDALVLATDRNLPAQCDALQQRLNVAEQRAGKLEGLLRKVIDSGALHLAIPTGEEIEADICAAFKPAEEVGRNG